MHRPPLEKLAHFAIEVCCLDFYLGTFCGAQAATHLHNGHTPAQWATDLATHLHNGHTCTFCGAQAATHSTHSVVHRPPHTCTMGTQTSSDLRPDHDEGDEEHRQHTEGTYSEAGAVGAGLTWAKAQVIRGLC